MKNDLFSSIGIAIVGVLIAYFVCNLFVGQIEDFSFKTVKTTVSTDVIDPNPEVFNYRALNPTVEVYVGDCTEYNSYGECVEEKTNNQENP